MGRTTRALALSVLLLLAGCGFVRDRRDAERTDGLVRDQTFSVAQTERNYHLYVPDDPANASIVLLLHGNGGSADQFLGLGRATAPYAVWLGIARRENLLLIVPDGLKGSDGKQGWNDCRTDAPTNPTSDDVTFLNSVIDEVRQTHAARTGRVFVAGTSNGGHMTQRLAEDSPEQFDAAAVVVASRPVNTSCDGSTVPLPILFMNGTDDPLSPYDGGSITGNRGSVMSTAETIDYWVGRNQSDSTPVQTELDDVDSSDGSRIVRRSFDGGARSAAVEHFEVVGGGHTEPSIDERYSRLFKRIVGDQNGDVEMAEVVWSFFEAQ